jgi:transketolase
MEAASTFGWAKYGNYNFGIDRFGESAPGPIIYDKFGFNIKHLSKIIENI